MRSSSLLFALIVMLSTIAGGTAHAAVTPKKVPRPAWAADAGTDQHGTWADLIVLGATQRMRFIPAGTFIMGVPRAEAQAALETYKVGTGNNAAQATLDWFDNAPQHQVKLTNAFWLGDTPVTQALWLAVMGSNPSKNTGDAARPVEQVSRKDCEAFYQKINEVARLNATFPTEAQWEYACRAGSTAAAYGQLEEIAWYKDNSGASSHPVRGKLPNAWGLYDMLGNVWQWCGDWYGDYPTKAVIDPVGPPDSGRHAARGGSYESTGEACRAGARKHFGDPSPLLGARLCIPAKR